MSKGCITPPKELDEARDAVAVLEPRDCEPYAHAGHPERSSGVFTGRPKDVVIRL